MLHTASVQVHDSDLTQKWEELKEASWFQLCPLKWLDIDALHEVLCDKIVLKLIKCFMNDTRQNFNP